MRWGVEESVGEGVGKGTQSLLAKRLKVRSTLKQEGWEGQGRELKTGVGRVQQGRGQGQLAPFFLSH